MTKTRFFRNNALLLTAFFSLLLFSACRKDTTNEDLNTPVAALMAFNLAPDQQSVSIGISGSLLPGGPLTYPAFTGRYLNVFPGSRLVQSVNATNGQNLDSVSYTFAPNRYYSLFVVGAGSTYRNIITEDRYDSLTASSGKAYVRYINALSNAASSTVVMRAGAADIANGTATFGQVSPFYAVDPGEISVQVNNEEATASRTLSVAQRKAYTVLLTGLPNQSDTTKSVQVRFIENGTLTD